MRVWPVVLVSVFAIGACVDRTAQIGLSIQETLKAAPVVAAVDEDVWAEVNRFYKERDHAPAWVQSEDASKITKALRVLQSADDHGFAASDYGANEVARAIDGHGDSEESTDETVALAQLDVRITTGLLALGHDVALGRSQPKNIDPRWKKRRPVPDFVGLLARAVEDDPSTWLASVQPQHPEYAALQKSLATLRAHPIAEGDDRRQLLAMNLERWRWMPDDIGTRHVIVNIPAFRLAVRESERAVLDMKVVVGEKDAEHRTPVFSGEMATVVFSPYWNVPDSIVEGETAPAIARDPSFLERNNIEILRQSRGRSEPVDPGTVDWDDAAELKQLLFRQRPGPGNALGHVKFLFQNPFNVYLHDTPADALFARSGRALSHGCVRLEQPEALAQYVLRDMPEWDDRRIRDAMNAGAEKPVALKEKLPVHIVYFTAWPRSDGGFDTWPDVYGYDAAQASHGAGTAK